jgi:hypothetical protein
VDLIVDGKIKVGEDDGPGKLLITDMSIFVLRAKPGVASIAGLFLGGVLGPLGEIVGRSLGQLLDRSKAAKNPPQYLNDPEVQELGSTVRQALLPTTLLAKFPLDDRLSVTSTEQGFDFKAEGHWPVSYRSRLNKKKVGSFLESRGVHFKTE